MKLSILVVIFLTVQSVTRAGFPQLSQRIFRVAPPSNKIFSVSGIFNSAMCALICKAEQCLAFSYRIDDRICETYFSFFEESIHAEISQSTLYFNRVMINSCADLIGCSSGVYNIGNDGSTVYCDMDTAGGPWTVIQRRTKGDVDFFRPWSDYKNGFGDLNGDFWLGNDNLHLLTNTPKILRVELEALTGERGYAEYSNFQVADESQNYQLLVGGFSGNIKHDAMAFSNLRQFSTLDRDNDRKSNRNCAMDLKSGWWHNTCIRAHLNGIFSKYVFDTEVMRWAYFPDPNERNRPLKTTKMMIR
ncbi:angiopoietin-related protein 7-like [Argopecten irradians]|uniref:angiopoietin-related protein 7-like n=1 Tax=Argopecten irradians TaxID=31199 RepID=UPI0037108C31